jgi:hypothetical protein
MRIDHASEGVPNVRSRIDMVIRVPRAIELYSQTPNNFVA